MSATTSSSSPPGDPDAPLWPYLRAALETPGWRFEADLMHLGRISRSLRKDAVIVEIGCLFGRTTIMLAGGRKVEGTGTVHCVDPFDASGDTFSEPHYRKMLAEHDSGNMLEHFNRYIGRCGLAPHIVVHRGTDATVSGTWTTPIDLLLLDGDQSPAGARRSFEQWIPHLVPGGWLALGNSADRTYAADHDGNARVFCSVVQPPRFTGIRRGDTSFAQLA